LRRPEFIARQASNPSGLLGRLLFRVMAAETLAVNERTLELLAPEPSARILEVGFGHGRTLLRAAEMAPSGFVAGIDISTDMATAA
jgi:ubiquinone/menaquinone biosynthesis C-methylase UbiE